MSDFRAEDGIDDRTFDALPVEEAMRAPAQVFCLGEHLAEEMIARGWKDIDVAERMKGDIVRNLLIVQLVLCVQKDSMLMDNALLVNLGRAFDVSPIFFRNLHNTWLRWPDRRSPFSCPDELLTPAFITPEPSND